MDIFDAVISWLDQQKAKGKDKIYLTPESHATFSDFLTISADPTRLQAWVDENCSGTEQLVINNEELGIAQVCPQVVEENIATSQSKQTGEAIPLVRDTENTEEKSSASQSLTAEEKESVLAESISAPSAEPKNHCSLPTTNSSSNEQYAIAVSAGESPEIIFLGEEAFKENSQVPFSQSVELLKKMVEAMQFSWSEVATVSVLKKCETVTSEEDLLRELDKIIKGINPKAIVIMGALPAKILLGTTDSILNTHGKWGRYENYPCMPTFHPFYLSRVVARKKEAWVDLQQIMSYLGRVPGSK